MTIEAALRAYLAAQSAITDKVGNKIYVDTAPQEIATPYIIIELSSQQPEYHATGEVNRHVSMFGVRYVGGGRLETDQYKNSRDLSLIVRPYLSGFQGLWDTMEIASCMIQRETPTVEFPMNGQEMGPASYTHDLRVWHGNE